MTGLSGAGKSTIAQATQKALIDAGYKVELIDGDVYRQHLCADLGFSKADRLENIRRLGFVGLTLVKHEVIVIMAVINPYQAARERLRQNSPLVKTVFVDCPLSITTERDTKGLYRRALLPTEHPDYIGHFTGISDPFELPLHADLTLQTDKETIEDSTQNLLQFILKTIKR